MFHSLKISLFLIFYFESAFTFVFQTPLVPKKYEIAFFEEAYFLGKSHRLTLSLNRCTNLSKQWIDQINSILTNGCVVVYPDLDCKSDKNQFFSSINFDFYDFFYSYPDRIPNYDFSNTW
jgi:hypothetical protein